MKASQFHVKNQMILTDDQGNRYLQSYDSIICKRSNTGQIILDRRYWDYSKTTGKYRNLFLNETKADTQKKIDSGVYKLDDLNLQF